MSTEKQYPLKTDQELVRDAEQDIELAGYIALKRILLNLEHFGKLEGPLLDHTISSIKRCLEQDQLLDDAFHLKLPVHKKKHGNAKSHPFEVACSHAVLMHHAHMSAETANQILCDITDEDRTSIQTKRGKHSQLTEWVTTRSSEDHVDLETLLVWTGSLRDKIVPFLLQDSES